MSIADLRKDLTFLGSRTTNPGPGGPSLDRLRLRIHDMGTATVTFVAPGVWAAVVAAFVQDAALPASGFSFVAASGAITWNGSSTRRTFITYHCDALAAVSGAILVNGIALNGVGIPIGPTRGIVFVQAVDGRNVRLRFLLDLAPGDTIQPVWANAFGTQGALIGHQQFTVD